MNKGRLRITILLKDQILSPYALTFFIVANLSLLIRWKVVLSKTGCRLICTVPWTVSDVRPQLLPQTVHDKVTNKVMPISMTTNMREILIDTVFINVHCLKKSKKCEKSPWSDTEQKRAHTTSASLNTSSGEEARFHVTGESPCDFRNAP
jgi:hypothetical protein